MARFEVTGPDGGRYEITAPDGASEQDVIAYVQQNAGSPPPASQGRSFAQPDLAGSIDVQGRADREIAAEPAPGPKPLAFGIPIIGPYLDEAGAAVASLPNKIAGVGPDYEKSLARIRARNKRAEAENPVQDTVGQVATGLTVGGPLLNKLFSPTASMVGNIVKGGVAGGGLGAVEGFGRGEGGVDNRVSNAVDGATIGGVVGAALPPLASGLAKGAAVASDAISPTLARWAASSPVQTVRGMFGREAPSQSVGAAAVPPPANPLPAISGPEAAADQVIANQLSRANVNTTDLRQRLAQARQANTTGPNVTALVDLDPSMQRLAGSVQRQQPEAGNVVRSFTEARQTGVTPSRGDVPPQSNLTTRGMMQAPPANAGPMGQSERFRAELREAFDIPRGSAYRNEQDMIAAARREANQLYGDAYQASAGVDVRQAIQPVLDRWRAIAADPDTPLAAGNLIRRAIQRYSTSDGTVRSLRSFQRAKEFLDDDIQKLMNAATGNQRARGGMLNDIQREMLAAVDAIPNVGARYSAARGAFSSSAEMREALDLGRQAAREGAEVSADRYAALSPGQQRMFRLGMFGELEGQVAGKRRNNDVGLLFESPRMQELLQVIMPPDRAERLGRFIQNEKTFTRTAGEALGNSKTAERLADDAALEPMLGLMDKIRRAGNARDAGYVLIQSGIDRLFGFRADTAAAIAHKLVTANPRDLDRLLQQLESRIGPSRADQFRNLMNAYNSTLSRAAAASTSPPPPNQNRTNRPTPRQP